MFASHQRQKTNLNAWICIFQQFLHAYDKLRSGCVRLLFYLTLKCPTTTTNFSHNLITVLWPNLITHIFISLVQGKKGNGNSGGEKIVSDLWFFIIIPIVIQVSWNRNSLGLTFPNTVAFRKWTKEKKKVSLPRWYHSMITLTHFAHFQVNLYLLETLFLPTELVVRICQCCKLGCKCIRRVFAKFRFTKH